MSPRAPSACARRIAEDLDARDAAIRAAHEAGDGPDAIAKALGMRPAAVIATLRRFGLEPPAGSPWPRDPGRAAKDRRREPRLLVAKPTAVAGGGRDAARARCCLRCGENFLSAHAGNRLCEPCTREIRTVADDGAYSAGGFEDAI